LLIGKGSKAALWVRVAILRSRGKLLLVARKALKLGPEKGFAKSELEGKYKLITVVVIISEVVLFVHFSFFPLPITFIETFLQVARSFLY
jgi:hypothetical protein